MGWRQRGDRIAAGQAVRGWTLLVLHSLLIGGCASVPTTAPEEKPDGDVVVALLAAGAEGRLLLQSGQSARGGKLDPAHAPLPVYPHSMLDQRLGIVRVEARLAVDTAGVAAIEETVLSEAPDTCQGECEQAFVDAVGAALRDWRFHPLEILDWVDGADLDGDGESDGVQRQVVAVQPFTLRFGFRFAQIDGRPRVGVEGASQ